MLLLLTLAVQAVHLLLMPLFFLLALGFILLPRVFFLLLLLFLLILLLLLGVLVTLPLLVRLILGVAVILLGQRIGGSEAEVSGPNVLGKTDSQRGYNKTCKKDRRFHASSALFCCMETARLSPQTIAPALLSPARINVFIRTVADKERFALCDAVGAPSSMNLAS
ncbi:MAG TPA: hypothetical protein VMT64_11560 [Candidatus Binataceae bacterium]|nr:hypothetical protein [Candidatus Binataceae bacterium]